MTHPRTDPHTAFVPQGHYAPHGTERIEWRLLGNQVQLTQNNQAIDLASLSDADAVNLAARVVATYHARYRDPEVNFHGTALHQMRDSKGKEWLVIDSNAHPADHFNRACAETTAMWQAKKLTAEKNPLLERTFLMGTYVDQPPSPEHVHASPCGHCRVELKARANDDSTFYALPSLSPDEMEQKDLKISPLGAPVPYGQQVNDTVFAMRVLDLLPHPQVRLPDSRWLGVISDAEKSLQAGELQWLELAVQAVDQGLSLAADSLVQVNEALVGAIARTHREMGGETESIRAVAVRTADGRTYVVAAPRDEGLPSKPPAVVAALMKSCNERNITDVFIMDYNPAQTSKTQEAAASGQPPTIEALDGGELDRIYKHRVSGQSVTIHILPFNDGTLEEQTLKSVVNSADISIFYPAAYVNPKSLVAGFSAGRA